MLLRLVFQGASEDFKAMLKIDPQNFVALVGFINAASTFDPNAADAMAESLPNIAGADDVDPEELEAKLLAGGSSVVNLDVKKNADAVVEDDKAELDKDKGEVKKKRSKNRKKKKRLPKDLDKPIDPERWVPKKLRKDYVAPVKKPTKANRGKKGRIGGAGGHQGVHITAEKESELDAGKKKEEKAKEAKEEEAKKKAAAAAKQQQNQTQQNKGGKKGKRRK